ncbi:MAG: hypothetical protein FWC50_07615 [Planctomycetaceae bacterium]|nr:hypothetical protein [Planctomycetaceae bacterium]
MMPTELYKKHQEFCERRSEVVCREKGIQYKLINRKNHEIAKIQVDGGVFPSSEHKKCDWLLVDCEELFGVLVELKGTDCQTAIQQIDKTLDLIKNKLKNHQITKVHGRIVLRRRKHTDHVSNAKRKLDNKLREHFCKGTLKIGNSPFDDSF